MAAAQILAPQPGEKVLDLASAPGEKATHLAELMKNTGLLIGNEIRPKRVWNLVDNLEWCGVTNAIKTNETSQILADHFGAYFDQVMLDAPCSGEGMFQKNELARREWRPELVHSCAIRQIASLEQASRMVKPGGLFADTTSLFQLKRKTGLSPISQSGIQNLSLLDSTIPGFQSAKLE
jgi:16S rRNA C967 or C1407 C5-methylase (RsmB/RsmF family)